MPMWAAAASPSKGVTGCGKTVWIVIATPSVLPFVILMKVRAFILMPGFRDRSSIWMICWTQNSGNPGFLMICTFTIFSISTILTAPENLSSDSVGLKGGGNRNIRKEHRSIHKLNYLNFNLFGLYFYRTFKGPCHIWKQRTSKNSLKTKILSPEYTITAIDGVSVALSPYAAWISQCPGSIQPIQKRVI